MNNKQKKLLGWLVTTVSCLTILIILFVVLPLLISADASTNKEADKTIENNRNEIKENPSIDDATNGSNGEQNNTNQGNITPDHGNTTPPEPTEPTPPEPVTPVEPVEPEPVNPTPTEPEQPEPTPTFELTKENLPGTVWYDANHQWYLTFNNKKNKYTITRADDNVTLQSGTWIIVDNTVTLTPDGEVGCEYSYGANVIYQTTYNYAFAWLPNATF